MNFKFQFSIVYKKNDSIEFQNIKARKKVPIERFQFLFGSQSDDHTS